MGNLVFNTFKEALMLADANAKAISLLDDVIKIGLTKTDDDPDDPDEEFNSGFLGAGDAQELTATGYTGGFGGAGRKTLASKTVAVDQVNNRAEFDCADITWTALSAGGPIVGFWTMVERVADTDSQLCWKFDTATGLPLSLNGSDVTITIDAEGLLHLT